MMGIKQGDGTIPVCYDLIRLVDNVGIVRNEKAGVSFMFS